MAEEGQSRKPVTQDGGETINQFDNLPDEMLYEIFSRVPKIDLFALTKVSRRFHRVCNDKRMWENVSLAHQVITVRQLEELVTSSLPIKKLNLNSTRLLGPQSKKTDDSHLKLEKLDLTRYGTYYCDMLHILRRTRTKELILDRPVLSFARECIKMMAKHEMLEVLSMEYWHFDSFDDYDFHILFEGCSRLRELNLTDCSIPAQQLLALYSHVTGTLEKLVLVKADVKNDVPNDGEHGERLLDTGLIAHSYEILFRRAKNLKFFGAPFGHLRVPAVMDGIIRHQRLETLCLCSYNLYWADFYKVLREVVPKVKKLVIFHRSMNKLEKEKFPAQLDRVRRSFVGLEVEALEGR